MYRSHGGQVWRAVLAMTAGRADIAEDATAEAFAQLFAGHDRARDPVAWVFRAAFRIAATEQRRERGVSVVGPADTAAEHRSALPDDLTAALRGLSHEQRVVVFLHYFADLPVREIARLTGVPTATVKVRLHRARRSLRESGELMARG